MQNFGVDGNPIFWCPRCGTIKYDYYHLQDFSGCPNLVERVLDFTRLGDMSAQQIEQWQRLGIEDATTRKEDHE
jgi:hypothetical protein